MNTTALRLAMKGINSAYNHYRNTDDKKQREVYEALTDALEDGDLTRDTHERLERRRAAFAAAVPEPKSQSKGSAGKTIGAVLAIAGTAAGAWAVWEYWLKDKLNEKNDKQDAPARPTTGSSRLVYSTSREDAADNAGTTNLNDPDNAMRPNVAGPLGEEPAERDEALLSSIDEQLTTLDTLDDDQREATAPRHTTGHTSSDVLGDTGSGKRSDKVSDADTTIGASRGRHELNEDNRNN